MITYYTNSEQLFSLADIFKRGQLYRFQQYPRFKKEKPYYFVHTNVVLLADQRKIKGSTRYYFFFPIRVTIEESFTGHQHGVENVQDKTDIRKISAGTCGKATMVVYDLIDLLEDGTNMHRYHGVSWVDSNRHVSHPRQLSGRILAYITGYLLQK